MNKPSFQDMSWEVQFRKSEAELDLKLSSFQNLSPENDSVQLEAEIETLLNKLNSIVKEQDQNPKVSRKIQAWVFFTLEFSSFSKFSVTFILTHYFLM